MDRYIDIYNNMAHIDMQQFKAEMFASMKTSMTKLLDALPDTFAGNVAKMPEPSATAATRRLARRGR